MQQSQTLQYSDVYTTQNKEYVYLVRVLVNSKPVRGGSQIYCHTFYDYEEALKELHKAIENSKRLGHYEDSVYIPKSTKYKKL